MKVRTQPGIRSPEPWNSCFSQGLWALFILALFFVGGPLYAINLNSIYFASCKREVGLILHVDGQKVDVLSLTGEVKSISRYDIIYLAYYPVGDLPITKVSGAQKTTLFKIKTLFDNNVVDLVQGWPVDFSEESISFLTLAGNETVIDRNEIFAVEKVPADDTMHFKTREVRPLRFIHPYPFSHCPDDNETVREGQEAKRDIYPQQLLGDPLIIKTELDRLEMAYNKIGEYERDQRFYPVPQVYSNATTLGLWFNSGSRYGASPKRSNNLIPALRSELSEGPFGFQRLLVTGSAPMLYSVHEEPQTQLYYRLKAEYAHFSIMYDIDRLLVGEVPYKWRASDLGPRDDRVNEIFHVGGGMDYRNFAIGYSQTSLQYGVRFDDFFFNHRMDMGRADLLFHHRKFIANFSFGEATDRKESNTRRMSRQDDSEETREIERRIQEEEDAKPDFSGRLGVYRLNLTFPVARFKPVYSLIYRNFKFTRVKDGLGMGEFHYRSKAMTNAVYLSYPLGFDLTIDGYVGIEVLANKFGETTEQDSSQKTYVKGGASLLFVF